MKADVFFPLLGVGLALGSCLLIYLASHQQKMLRARLKPRRVVPAATLLMVFSGSAFCRTTSCLTGLFMTAICFMIVLTSLPVLVAGGRYRGECRDMRR
ncbi:hypothetical protein [Swaminathania salitolerans]|uniref:Lipoprotein n=1 Tax=Swaminathania salitolerans TaxID=182838 RepID=A0A511BZD2_9PROT|nr:hypothetical protein [Swaminathania salitolerans]GEL03368.1 hypothetical protein SSA02_25310 [Swaminathania salitolerans]